MVFDCLGAAIGGRCIPCAAWGGVGDILYTARGGVLPLPHAAHKKGVEFGGLPVFTPSWRVSLDERGKLC